MRAATTGITLTKEYFYADVAVNGRKDLLQVTHDFGNVTLTGGSTSLVDPAFDVAYYYDSYYARPKGSLTAIPAASPWPTSTTMPGF